MMAQAEPNTEGKCAWLVAGTETFGVGGPVLTLAEGLRRRHLQSVIVGLEQGVLTDAADAEGFPVRILDEVISPLVRGGLFGLPRIVIERPLTNRRVAEKLADVMAETGAQFLGFRWPSHLEAAGGAARKIGVPCYWLMPNEVSRRWPLSLNQRYYRYQLERLNVTPLPNSLYTARTLGVEYDQAWLHLGVDERRFAPDSVTTVSRQSLGIREETSVFAIVARLTPDKGQSRFLQAMLNVVADGADLTLLLVGGPTEDEYANELRRMASEHGAEARLLMAGWTASPEAFYSSVDVAVNARLSPEPFGLSVIEAMLMAKPVLVHALGGPAETVLHGETGWHVEQPTVESFEAGIRNALNARGSWKEMGHAARRHALANFSTDAFAANFLGGIGRS